MAKKVLSIEIGHFLTRIMEVDYKAKNPKVYHCVDLQTPEGFVNDGVIAGSDEFVAAIRETLNTNKIRTRQVVFTITSSKVASREVKIPKVKENRIGTLVETNAVDYFPVQLSDYELGYTVLEAQEVETGQMRLLVYAAPKKILQGYHDLAAACGLSVVGFDFAGNSLYQVVKSECDSGTQMVVKLEEQNALIVVLQDQRLVLQRNMPYGVGIVLKEYMEDRNLGYQEALNALRQNNCVSQGEAGPKSAENLEYLIGGILRVVDYFKAKNKEAMVDEILLTGLGGEFAGLSERMTQELGLPVETLKRLEGYNTEKNFKESSLGEYIGCLGAVIEPLGFMHEEKETAEKDGNTLNGAAVLVFAGGILISLALLMASLLPYLSAKRDNSSKKLYLISLQYMEDIYNEYASQKAENEYLQALNTATMNHNEEIVAFINELEQKMPSDIRVRSLVCDEQSVTMSVEVSNKNEAAQVVDTLAGFSSLADVMVSGVSDETDENGSSMVSFTVQCTYYPYGITSTESETQEVAQ